EPATRHLGVLEGDLGRERLRQVPRRPLGHPPGTPSHEPRRVLPLAPEREVQQPRQPLPL
ncbi:MAG: hypothetical protein AVDCRST_MAG01-01-1375, partial [uncultured Rubrobacteraceae bacterium]